VRGSANVEFDSFGIAGIIAGCIGAVVIVAIVWYVKIC
jgi:tetrahydromethanopterin S-methyltransferase subunit F